jgi:hypothetical protein
VPELYRVRFVLSDLDGHTYEEEGRKDMQRMPSPLFSVAIL